MSSIYFGNPIDPAAVAQLDRCLAVSGDDARGVLCADHHKGYSMPIGGVVASKSVVMPAGVGYDIGCGNMAVRTNVKAADVDVPKVMDEIFATLSFGMGRKNDEKADSLVLDAIARSPMHHIRSMASLAASQLGTIGSGNHYVDLFEDRADGALWIGVHFGSRGFGHKTASGFLALAAGKSWGDKTDDSMDAPPTVIQLGTDLATDYLEAMNLAGEYAYAGREWVVSRVLRILGLQQSDVTFSVHNHHNFAWWETHFGERYLVTRKGATPAFPAQHGFIGGSMGDDAVIIVGQTGAQSEAALYSTVHGAGRAMSRTAAAGKFNRKTGEQKSPGLIDWPAVQAQLKTQGVELRGGGADEAPGAYKRLPDVLAAHGDTIGILHTLRPIGVAMAGRDTYDPFKD
jgi:tRNA-splicing ligase RtcB